MADEMKHVHVSTLAHQDASWCVQRLPKRVKELLKAYPNEAFVAGGFIRSCIANEEINDVDIFAPSREKAREYAEKLQGETDTPIFSSDNAYTLRMSRGPALQVIHRWTFTSPRDCLLSFDYTIACAALYMHKAGNDEIVWTSLCDPAFYRDLAAKRLVYRFPIRDEEAGGSLLRMLKFYQRGYRIPLDSLAGVVTRAVLGIKDGAVWRSRDEKSFSELLTKLLYEVDPSINLARHAYLPSRAEEQSVLRETGEAKVLEE